MANLAERIAADANGPVRRFRKEGKPIHRMRWERSEDKPGNVEVTASG